MTITNDIAKSLVDEIEWQETLVRAANDDLEALKTKIANYQVLARRKQEYIDSCVSKIELFRKALDELKSKD